MGGAHVNIQRDHILTSRRCRASAGEMNAVTNAVCTIRSAVTVHSHALPGVPLVLRLMAVLKQPGPESLARSPALEVVDIVRQV